MEFTKQLAQANETIKGLQSAARFWQDKAGDMSEQVRKLEASLREQHQNQLDLLEQLAQANETIKELQSKLKGV